MRKFLYIFFSLAAGLILAGCGSRAVPKPYGYFRIDFSENTYQSFDQTGYPYRFDYSTLATICPRNKAGEEYWLDVYYPRLNARIHCSWLPVKGNLRELGDDAQEFVFKHAVKASSIPEQGYENPEERVYGVYYELKGNTASPYQFYLTDSTHNFFRGSVYFNDVPNQDSLAPVVEYLGKDVQRLIESFRWK